MRACRAVQPVVWGAGTLARKIQALVEMFSTVSSAQGPLATAASVLLPFSFSEAGHTLVSTGPKAPPIMMQINTPGARGTDKLRIFCDRSVSALLF